MDIAREKKTAEDKSQMSLNINFQNELLCRFESSRPHHHGWSLYIKHYIISKSGSQSYTKSLKSFFSRKRILSKRSLLMQLLSDFLIKSFKCIFFCFLQGPRRVCLMSWLSSGWGYWQNHYPLREIWDLSQSPDVGANPTSGHETRCCHENFPIPIPNSRSSRLTIQQTWLRECPQFSLISDLLSQLVQRQVWSSAVIR